MTHPSDAQHRPTLQRIARKAMLDRGLVPDFSQQALAELDQIPEPAPHIDNTMYDLRKRPWCSIDDEESQDLDQLTVAEAMPEGAVKILVAIADVDSIVIRHSAIDHHAKLNTTSVYTAARIFPMLPEKLSTDLTSLCLESDRPAMVVEMIFAQDGSLQSSGIYQAAVRNHAKLAYNSVAAWLEGTGPMPEEVGLVKGLEENLRTQDSTAHKLKALRHHRGALDLQTTEVRPVFDGDTLVGLEADRRNRARNIIENFMIAANGVTAGYLAGKEFATLRRVVRMPRQWDKIVELALKHNFPLPHDPDSKALDRFLTYAKDADPDRFPDLSLSVIKLLGPGEYVVEVPGGVGEGHFGLAVEDYASVAAPNRRFADLVTQRMVKAATAAVAAPYATTDLETLAHHCTAMASAAKKVQRQVVKSAAALLLESRIGESFDALVTGASVNGTWVRLSVPPVEGRLVRGFEGLEVGRRLRVRLLSAQVTRGFLDFERV